MTNGTSNGHTGDTGNGHACIGPAPGTAEPPPERSGTKILGPGR